MPTCSKCGGWSYDLAYHQHLPAFHVRRDWEDGEDDGARIYAADAGRAAEMYAQQVDEGGDYHIIGGSPATIVVTAEDGTRKTFEVSGEAVPSYHASPLTA